MLCGEPQLPRECWRQSQQTAPKRGFGRSYIPSIRPPVNRQTPLHAPGIVRPFLQHRSALLGSVTNARSKLKSPSFDVPPHDDRGRRRRDVLCTRLCQPASAAIASMLISPIVRRPDINWGPTVVFAMRSGFFLQCTSATLTELHAFWNQFPRLCWKEVS